ncbi:ATP synthase subunit I [uncultured Thiodictyon sp.]|uniref:ATP synthase subunit I n=1 Tax=uncultured Thiodictyon sp. TaxID=1846217 RepID=UPI0025EC8090|nr:ATP synthase subunit I [uncultured Thiodictyon sp.]
MNELLPLAPALLAGLVLGALFFGGLWWTVRQCLSSPTPARWLLGSLVIRTGIVLAGFYRVGDGQWERLVACLLGFLIARLILIRLTGPSATATEVSHAPEP